MGLFADGSACIFSISTVEGGAGDPGRQRLADQWLDFHRDAPDEAVKFMEWYLRRTKCESALRLPVFTFRIVAGSAD